MSVQTLRRGISTLTTSSPSYAKPLTRMAAAAAARAQLSGPRQRRTWSQLRRCRPQHQASTRPAFRRISQAMTRCGQVRPKPIHSLPGAPLSSDNNCAILPSDAALSWVQTRSRKQILHALQMRLLHVPLSPSLEVLCATLAHSGSARPRILRHSLDHCLNLSSVLTGQISMSRCCGARVRQCTASARRTSCRPASERPALAAAASASLASRAVAPTWDPATLACPRRAAADPFLGRVGTRYALRVWRWDRCAWICTVTGCRLHDCEGPSDRQRCYISRAPRASVKVLCHDQGRFTLTEGGPCTAGVQSWRLPAARPPRCASRYPAAGSRPRR